LAQAGIDVQVRSYEERAMSASAHGGDARACAFVEIATPCSEGYGVGMDDNIVTASIKAIVSAINRQPHAVIPHMLTVSAD
jgi:2-isopropylmalate synthase